MSGHLPQPRCSAREKDRVEAYVWLSLAAHHGAGHALNALKSLVAAVLSEEKQQGAQLLAEFHSRRMMREVRLKQPGRSDA
jgi:TPR repeat protein